MITITFYLELNVTPIDKEAPYFSFVLLSENRNYLNKLYRLMYFYKSKINHEVNISMTYGIVENNCCGIICENFIEEISKLPDDFFFEKDESELYKYVYMDMELNEEDNYIHDYLYFNNDITRIHMHDFNIKHIEGSVRL